MVFPFVVWISGCWCLTGTKQTEHGACFCSLWGVNTHLDGMAGEHRSGGAAGLVQRAASAPGRVGLERLLRRQLGGYVSRWLQVESLDNNW